MNLSLYLQKVRVSLLPIPNAITKSLREMKTILYGNSEAEPVPEACSQLTREFFNDNTFRFLVQCHPKLNLEVLTNGIEVKLQRHALSVIEAPTGNEDDDLEFKNTQWHGTDMASDNTQKSQKSRPRMHKSLGPSHKSMSRSFSVDSQSKRSIFMPQGWTVDAVPNPSKEQLIDVIQCHFMS